MNPSYGALNRATGAPADPGAGTRSTTCSFPPTSSEICCKTVQPLRPSWTRPRARQRAAVVGAESSRPCSGCGSTHLAVVCMPRELGLLRRGQKPHVPMPVPSVNNENETIRWTNCSLVSWVSCIMYATLGGAHRPVQHRFPAECRRFWCPSSVLKLFCCKSTCSPFRQ
jgi:hypothetical protein